jgi:nicotinamide riboside kinase
VVSEGGGMSGEGMPEREFPLGGTARSARGAHATAHIVSILGAESTGKTTLAAALGEALDAQGLRVAVVAEFLREFCEHHGRTPSPDEQTVIADEQWHRIETAARGADIVIADTTPLMTAIYSDYVFGDASLYADALQRQARCALTLVTGLDLAWQPDGLQRDGPQVRVPIDAMLRGALDSAGLGYALVYGAGSARLAAALQAVRRLPSAALAQPAAADEALGAPHRLRGRCSECLQADCEHRLFTSLR